RPGRAAAGADALRGGPARARGAAAAAADAFARGLGPDLGFSGPWRCAACTATAERWSARCTACDRWDTLRASSEDAGGSTRHTSDLLIRPARGTQVRLR